MPQVEEVLGALRAARGSAEPEVITAALARARGYPEAVWGERSLLEEHYRTLLGGVKAALVAAARTEAAAAAWQEAEHLVGT